jgi:hypothetical protein
VRPPGAGPPIRPGSTAPSSGAISTAASDSADGVAVGDPPEWAGCSTGPAVGSVSIAMIGVPTSTVSPSPWKIALT